MLRVRLYRVSGDIHHQPDRDCNNKAGIITKVSNESELNPIIALDPTRLSISVNAFAPVMALVNLNSNWTFRPDSTERVRELFYDEIAEIFTVKFL